MAAARVPDVSVLEALHDGAESDVLEVLRAVEEAAGEYGSLVRVPRFCVLLKDKLRRGSLDVANACLMTTVALARAHFISRDMLCSVLPDVLVCFREPTLRRPVFVLLAAACRACEARDKNTVPGCVHQYGLEHEDVRWSRARGALCFWPHTPPRPPPPPRPPTPPRCRRLSEPTAPRRLS